MSFHTPKLLQIMANPSVISDSDLEGLKQAVQQYPYFQLGHVLIAKATHDRQSADAYDRLHHAAIYAPSRKKLKQLFYEENNSSASVPSETEAPPQHDATTADTSDADQATSTTQEEAEDQAIYQELQENLHKLQQMRKKNTEEHPQEQKPGQESSAEEPEDASQASAPESRNEAPQRSDIESAHKLDYLQELTPLQQEAGELPQNEQMELIDKFINSERNVRIRWRYQENEPEDLSEKNTSAWQNVATENLAGLYVKQGRKDKAIEIYEQLILKYPDKKTYFAEKIESLKEN